MKGWARPPRQPLASLRGTDRGVELPHPSEEANLAMVTGAIMGEPVRDKSREGHPVTLLLVGFKPPDEIGRDYAACVDVEVLDSIADPQRKWLRKGRRLVVLGRLTGEGGLWATAIVADMPDRCAQELGRRS
jgi:hypothetical protein